MPSHGEHSRAKSRNPAAIFAVTLTDLSRIITPTIIDEANFKAWRDESFSIWREWSKVYSPRSATHKFLADIADKYWLVNVIHHEFPEKNALWDLLIKS